MRHISTHALVRCTVWVCVLLVCGFGVWSVVGQVPATEAVSTVTVSGWAWMSGDDPGTVQDEGGMGWLSLSCETGGLNGENICAQNSYGLMISDDPNHYVTGYAYYSHSASSTGWVRFGGLSGCPAGSCDARVIADGAGGWELSGWARDCAVYVSGCSGAEKAVSGSELGGWDGWISLNCENTGTCGTVDYAVRLDPLGIFSSNVNTSAGAYAWGDINMNWLNFSGAILNGVCAVGSSAPICSSDLTVSHATKTNIWCEAVATQQDCAAAGQVCSTATGVCSSAPTVVTFSVAPTVVRQGDQVTVEWEVYNVSNCDVAGVGLSASGLAGATTFTAVTNTGVTLTCDGVEMERNEVNVLPFVYES